MEQQRCGTLNCTGISMLWVMQGVQSSAVLPANQCARRVDPCMLPQFLRLLFVLCVLCAGRHCLVAAAIKM